GAGKLRYRTADLFRAQENSAVVAVKRPVDVGLKRSPEMAAHSPGFQQEIVSSLCQHALESRFPSGGHLRQVMAILDEHTGKKKAARIDITSCPIAQTPANV